MTAKTLKRLERAAVGWYEFCVSVGATKTSFGPQARALFIACAAHAQRKSAKRKVKALATIRALKREPNAAAQADLGPETDGTPSRSASGSLGGGAVHPDAEARAWGSEPGGASDRGARAGNVVAGPATAAPDVALREAIESAPVGDFATTARHILPDVAEMVKRLEDEAVGMLATGYENVGLNTIDLLRQAAALLTKLGKGIETHKESEHPSNYEYPTRARSLP